SSRRGSRNRKRSGSNLEIASTETNIITLITPNDESGRGRGGCGRSGCGR
ncbi:10186_t:CDS:2, partial [Funneliformis caledonium]